MKRHIYVLIHIEWEKRKSQKQELCVRLFVCDRARPVYETAAITNIRITHLSDLLSASENRKTHSRDKQT